MSNKLLSIIMLINYVAYLILVLPLIFLYYFLTNPFRRVRSKRELRKILKQGGIPKDLRKKVVGSYTDFTKALSFRNLIKQRKNNEEKDIVRGLTIVTR
jgi:hypothetical protein